MNTEDRRAKTEITTWVFMARLDVTTSTAVAEAFGMGDGDVVKATEFNRLLNRVVELAEFADVWVMAIGIVRKEIMDEATTDNHHVNVARAKFLNLMDELGF